MLRSLQLPELNAVPGGTNKQANKQITTTKTLLSGKCKLIDMFSFSCFLNLLMETFNWGKMITIW